MAQTFGPWLEAARIQSEINRLFDNLLDLGTPNKETARGEWLELVATAGLAHSSALLRYLASGENRIERHSSEHEGFVTRSVFRKKPVLPVASDETDAPEDAGR